MKHTYMTLAIIAALSLTACGGSDDKDMVKDKDTSTGSTQDHNQDQDKDKNKDKDQGNKGSAGSSSAGSSASSSSASSNYGASPAIKKLFAPPPAALSVDAEKIPLEGSDEELKNLIKPKGDGAIVVQWDNKFKAMNANPNLKKASGKVDRTKLNEDGTRPHLTTSWNKISITHPNTIVGHDGGINDQLSTTTLTSSDKKVGEAATIDLLKAQLRRNQNLTIKLADGSEVKVQYQAKVLNLGHQDGDYVAQAVHVFGSELAENGDKKPIDIAYVYGIKTKDSFDGVENLPEKAKYEGIASYQKHGKPHIYSGTASFDVEFNASAAQKATVKNGKINIPGTHVNYEHSGPYDVNGISFYDQFNNTGSFERPTVTTDSVNLRGYFYGKNAQYLGGTFYDNEGAGTFFTGDKERGGEVKAQGRR